MSEVDPTLQQGEDLVSHSRLHPVVAIGPIVVVAAGSILLSLGKGPAVAFSSLLWACIGAVWICSAVITYLISEVGVTDRRVVVKTGLFRRRLFEIPLDRLDSVTMRNEVLTRFFDVGSLEFYSTDEQVSLVKHVPHPSEFRSAVQSQRLLHEHKRPAPDDGQVIGS